MSNKLRNMVFSVVLAGLAVVAVAPPAHANRGTYTPPIENNDDNDVVTEVLGSNEQTPNPVVTDPPADTSGTNNPAPLVVPQVNSDPAPAPAPAPAVAPENAGSTLPRTGTTILPMVQAGMAALVLGLGFMILARRRRAAVA
jgi:LPXTG-motif cell wall-anchored protein